MAVLLGAAVVITALLLPLSIYPGVASELAFFAAIASPLWLPAAFLCWWAFVDAARELADRFEPYPRRRRWLGAFVLVLALNCSLLWFEAPRRLAFFRAKRAFEASVHDAPMAYSDRREFDRRFGPYHVDQRTADPRGGVYFRTRAARGAFQASKLTYGFAYRPNPAGSPFGDEQYALSHIEGDWYVFRAAEP
jgi:hypothetical protein